MSRLNDADISRLLAGLGQLSPERDAAAAAQAPDHIVEVAADQNVPAPARAGDDQNEIAQLRARLEAAERDGSLAGSLRALIREYLGAAVECDVGGEAHALIDPLRFEGGEPLQWHLDVAGSSAAAIGDIIIGGDGTSVRHTKRRRLGRLLEPLATRVISAMAARADAVPAAMRFIEVPRRSAEMLIFGSIEAAGARGGWIASAALRSGRASASPSATRGAPAVPTVSATPIAAASPAPPSPVLPKAAAARTETSPPPHEVVHAVSAPPELSARQQSASPPRERVIAARPVETNGAFSSAVAAACSRLGELARSSATPRSIAVSRVETPALSREDLKLALIAGGQGSLVLSASPVAMTSVAAATVGVETPADGKPGAVVVDAVEAVLRAALRAFAENLPGLAGGPLRFVRLAEGALPARSPHYSVIVPVDIGDREATLQWLVPTWMAAPTSQERAPSDAR